MKTILILPMWVLSLSLRPFLPRTHPWKSGWPTLRSWAKQATELSFALSFALWIGVIELVALFVLLRRA